MRVNVSDISAQRLFLGWTGENKHIQFAYDFTGMFTEYPDAGVSMTVHPPVGDDYPHTLTRDGNILLWEVLASDCAHEGDGTYQITFTQGEHVAKSLVGFFTVRKSLTGSGEAPEPVQDWIADAEAALFALTGMQARAVTLDPGSAATAQIVEENGRKVIVIGVPEGLQGVPGVPGKDGEDGAPGAPGAPGKDGVTPAFSIGTVTTLPAGSPATVTITGTTEAPVLNLGIPRGADGHAGDLIDDNAGAGVTGKTWSANKLATSVLSALTQKQDKPQTPGTAGQVLSLDNNLDPIWADAPGADESGLAPVIKSTASGEIASFADGADCRNIDSLVVNITPVQDLHGQDSPYPAGGGKNKINASDVTLSSGGYLYNGAIVLPAGTYTISFTKSTSGIPSATVVFYDGNGDAIVSGSHNIPWTFTLASDSASAKIYVSEAATYSKIQVESGSSATSYAPYENLCPISGWTGCDIYATGQNLFNPANVLGGYLVSSGKFVASSGGEKTVYAFLRPGTYRYSKEATTTVYRYGVFDSVPENGEFGTILQTNVSNKYAVFTLTKASYLLAYCYNNTGETTPFNEVLATIQIVSGSGTVGLAPYTGTTLPISWQSVAGTVYGGQDEVIGGNLKRTYADVDLGSLTWELRSTGLYRSEVIPDIKTVSAQSEPVQGIAEKYRVYSYSYAKNHLDEFVIGINSGDDKHLYVSGGVPGSGKFVYELAEPVQYQLNPNQVATLLGQNNIWSNCGSIESVVYSADTKTYVDDAIPAVPVTDVQVNGTSILTDGVANVPLASTSAFGAVKVSNGLQVKNSGLCIFPASAAALKAGTQEYNPVAPSGQHYAVFYGLSKVAGANLANVTVTLGQYPENAKSAIHEMLNGSVSVSGTTPTITALPGIRYVCGEVATLTVNLPASGIVDIVFESGSTATVLTVTPPTGVTVKWANGFDPTALDANTTYEINICDGLGVAASWT